MNYLEMISEKIFDCALAAVVRQLNYLIHYKNNVDNLKTQVEELQEAKVRVKQGVDAAKRNVEEIHDDVQKWLSDSDGITIEAEEIFGDNGQAKITCCNGWCPNFKSCYRLSKRAVEMKSKVEESKKNGNFSKVGYREPIQAVGFATLNRGYEAFESRRTALTGVLEALKDPNINKIGVYGTGGMGKTMLQEKILIVIDDIWKPLDLEAHGIFFGDDKKGCKILLTSRSHNVLRNDMNTQKEFQVGVLSDNEAKNLFQKIVVGLTKTPEIQATMEEIIEECAGLPIAITTVANFLKNQENINVWKDALQQLKTSSPTEIEGMDEKVYKSIKLSYEFLQSKEAKSLFLLCSLHGEDSNIDVEDLLRYGVGLGWFRNVDTMENARHRVDTLVERLKDSSLLLDGDDNGTVKMHDIIRDVAINIAA
uniref:NB-ARC domain-containing protein n=1 Tax=Fagus sylvatica TaxID=28930 RepID=A0A2N9JBY9_FAGSY